MKSFIAALTQTDLYTPPRQVQVRQANAVAASVAVRTEISQKKYLSLFDKGDLSTVEIATKLGVKNPDVMKQLIKLERRGLIWRAGYVKANGPNPSVIWSSTRQGDVERTSADRYTKALKKYDRTTEGVARTCRVTYYAALAKLKLMEADGLVKRVDVDRSISCRPSIIWHLVARDAK